MLTAVLSARQLSGAAPGCTLVLFQAVPEFYSRIEVYLTAHLFVESPRLGRVSRAYDNFQLDQFVARRLARQAAPLEPQALAGARARRNRHLHGTTERRHLDLCPECRLPGRHGQRQHDVVALEPIDRMRANVNFQIKIARCAATIARFALPAQADL